MVLGSISMCVQIVGLGRLYIGLRCGGGVCLVAKGRLQYIIEGGQSDDVLWHDGVDGGQVCDCGVSSLPPVRPICCIDPKKQIFMLDHVTSVVEGGDDAGCGRLLRGEVKGVR